MRNISEKAKLTSEGNDTTEKLHGNSKLKHPHKEYLKSYLNKDNFILPIEARNRLQEEHDLEMGINTVRYYLKKLRKELGLEYTKLDPITFKSRQLSYRTKIKDTHLECLKKYLYEDYFIVCTEAKNRLQEETGLNVSIPIIRKTMKNLRKEIDLEHPSRYLSTNKNRKLRAHTRLKDSHLELLKEYLKEDSSIGPTKAKYRFQKATGLDPSIQTIYSHLKKLNNEISQENTKLDSSTTIKVKPGRKPKLNDAHFESLKKYLEEDRYILPTEVKSWLQEEFDIKLSIYAVKKYLKTLREKLGPEYVNLNPSTIKSRQMNTRTKIKGSHLECLKKYLKEDSSIGPTKAKNKIQEETGLIVAISTIHNAIKKLKETN